MTVSVYYGHYWYIFNTLVGEDTPLTLLAW